MKDRAAILAFRSLAPPISCAPAHLEAGVIATHREDLSLRSISAWLSYTVSVTASREAASRTLALRGVKSEEVAKAAVAQPLRNHTEVLVV